MFAKIQTQIVLSVVALLGFSLNSAAASARVQTEVPVLKVESTYPQRYQGALTATLAADSDRTIDHFHFADNQGFNRDYSIEEIRSGVILVHALNKDLIVLRSKDFEAEAGGQIQLMFYRDFLGDDRRQLQFTYLPEGSDWVIRTNDSAGRDVFDSLSLQIKTVLGAPTGVNEIRLYQEGNSIRRYNPAQLPKATLLEFLFQD